MVDRDGQKVGLVPRSNFFDLGEDVAIVFHEVNFPTGLHVHEFFELVYVESGSLIHHYGPTVHHVKAGDFFIVNPTVPHGYDLTPDGPARIWNIILTERALNLVSTEADTSHMIGELIGHERYALNHRRLSLSEPLNKKVKRIVHDMDDEFRQKRHGYQVALRGYLVVLVGLISRALQESGVTVQPTPSPQSKLGDLTRYIVDHCDEPLTVEQLAARCGWTPDHLNRVLKKAVGDTVQEYIGRIRVARAARLLLIEGLTVNDVARRVGYGDARALRRAFRRYHGVSPAQFRQISYVKDGEHGES